VQLEIGKWSGRTPTLSNSGDSPVWNLTEPISFEVTKSILSDIKLKASVLDENTMRAHSFLGSGFTSLRLLAPKINNSHTLSVELSDHGEKCGRLTIEAILREAKLEEQSDSIPEHLITLRQGTLNITSITTCNIIGGDSGGVLGGGKQVSMLQFFIKQILLDWLCYS
jgi:hypothetical protein